MKPSIGGETEPSEMAAAAGRSAHRPQQLHFKSNNQVKKVGRSWRTFYQLLFRQIFSGVCVLLINFRNEMRRHLPGGPGQRLRHRRLGRCRLRRPRERERGRKRAEDDRCACFFLHWLIVGDSFVFLSCFFVSLISSDQYFDWFIPFSLSFSWWNIGGRSTGDFNSISFQSHRIFCPFLFLMLTARIIRPESVRVSAQSHLPADGISTTHPTPLQLKLRIRSIQSPSGAGGGGGGADSVPTFPLPVQAHQRRHAAASLDTVASFQPFAKTKRNAATALKENNKIWKNKKRMARDFFL